MADRSPRPLCQRCQTAKALKDEKFRRNCRREVLAELRDTGYLTPKVHHFGGAARSTEQKENTLETKHGTGHG